MYLAFGSHPLIMAMINSTLSALCVVLVYRLATHLGTRRAARIAAAAVAVWPSALLWGSQVMKDVPSLCLLLVIVVLTCELFDDVRRGWPALVLSGSGLFMVSMFLETLRNYLVMMFLVAVVSALVLTGVRARRLRIGQVVAVVALGLGLLTTRLVGQDLVLRVLDPTHSRTAIKPFVTRIVAADPPANAPLFGRLAGLRNGFIRTGGGSLYTHEGVTNETGWLQWLRWAPEAFVAALGAPFPWQWRQAGRIEPMRVAVGSESLVLLLLLPLMLFACWRIVRTWAAGGLVFVLFFFMFATSLGLTVVNVGTLVRLRLPVIFLGLVLAAVGLAAWRAPASVAGETVDREEPPPLDASSRGRDQVSLCS
jgi:4-amino-4-deoxy-L-arabinose transferase-like glycosyltransferase